MNDMITQRTATHKPAHGVVSKQNGLYKHRFTLLLLLLLLSPPQLQAGTEVYRASLSGNEIVDGATLTVTDSEDSDNDPVIREQRIMSLLTLRVTDPSAGLAAGATTTVRFEITYKDEQGNDQTLPEQTLTVSNDGRYLDRQSYRFEAGLEVKLTITHIDGDASALTLENILQVERLYPFDYSAPTGLNVSPTPVNGTYTVSWDSVGGAEEYQLEWLHVNNYKGVALPYDFSQNATRITTKETTYEVSSLFEKGYVLFRVRAVTYASLDKPYALPGAWTCQNGGTCSGTSVSTYPTAERIQITDSHTQDRLNWQSVANYAEEGKKKETVTYYDGTMRSHQAVTRLNTDNNILVGETYYDRLGRPAVQALPVPVEVAQGEEKSLRFYPDFNKNENGKGYGREDFDAKEDPCGLSASPMKTTSGAARYYSSNNPDQTGFNRFIPDAKQYPFSQTEYTADNTGRIKRQGGVGAAYQLGNGHETRYLYGTVNQQELNSLFGGEAGNSAHYRKNTVIDANGELSVSYLDMYGRVVATALSGTPAEGTEGLASFAAAKDTVVNILNNRPVAEGSYTLRNTYFHTVTTASEQKFVYSLPDIHFDSEGNPTEGGVCLDCVYDLTLDMVDECGKRPDLTAGEASFPITKTISARNYACGADNATKELSFGFTTEKLPIGTYAISRTLTVNKETLEANTTRYAESLSGIPTLKEVIEAEKAKTDVDGCRKPDCRENCLLELGANATLEAFLRCKANCEYSSECARLEELMASDLMPGQLIDEKERFKKATDDQKEQTMGGQYALYTVSEEGVYAPGDDHSIFADETQLNKMYDLLGEDFVGELPTDPTQSEKIRLLVENFRPEWAKELMDFHPEKCRLEVCRKNEESGSLQYENLMSLVETYEEAYALGLLNPLGISQPDLRLPPASQSQADPFFQPGGMGYSAYNEMKEKMFNDKIEGGNQLTDLHLSMWRKAVLLSGVCQEYATTPSSDVELSEAEKQNIAANLEACLQLTNNYALAPLTNTEACSRDRVWTFFRALYRAAKEEIKRELSASGDCSPSVDDAKRKRFPENKDLFSEDEWQVIEEDGSDEGKIQKLQAGAETQIKEMCEMQAFAQIDKIMTELTECKLNPSATTVWDETNEKYTAVAKAFTDIMIYTCSQTNLFGSTDIPQELQAGKPAGVAYNSFDEALEGILGEENINLTCNAELISFPKQSGHEYTDLVAYKPLDSCGCALLLEADAEYADKKARNALPLWISSGRKYFEEEYGFSIDNYQAKICLCRDEMTNPEKINERLATYNEFIPRGIACETCTDCPTIQAKLLALQEKRSYLLNYTDLFGMIARDEIRHLALQRIVENHLNNVLNLNFNYGEYQTFLRGCDRLEDTGEESTVCNETPDERAGRLITLLGSLSLEPDKEQCTPAQMNPEVRAVFPESAINSCSSYLYDASLTADFALTIAVYAPNESPSTACPVTLRFTENPGAYRYGEIVRLDKNSIRPVAQTQGNDNESNDRNDRSRRFLVDAVLAHRGKLITVPVEVTTCFSVFTCYDQTNKADYTLCPHPQATHKAPEDDCAESLLLTAMKNGERIYETLEENAVTAFRTQYTRRCLSSNGSERLDMTFKANERHYTLYYYDQAGNLVRTVPPEGVELVDESLFSKIDQDRENDTMTVFTRHRMETRYLYNSLNQLVAQYMPDHDAFEEISLAGKAGGLPGNLRVDALSFDGSHGVLFGSTPALGKQSMGYVTYDGGESWTEITDLGIRNLNGLCKIPGAGTLCLVGDEGTLLKSSASGWTTINTQVREDIVSVNFTDSRNGYFFTSTGKIYQTANGGDAWTPASSIGLTQLEQVHFTSANNGYAVGSSAGRGAVFVTTNGGRNWQREEAEVADLALLQTGYDQTAYAVDKNGILLKISGSEAKPVASAEHTAFKKIHFVSPDKALALTQTGGLRASLDGGKTWHAPDGTEEQSFKDMAFVGEFAYLLTDDNQIFRRTAANNFNTSENVTSNDFSGKFNTIYFENAGTGYVAGNNGVIYYTDNAGRTWTKLTPDETFGQKNIAAVYSNPGGLLSPTIHAVTDDGLLYKGEVQTDNSVRFSQVSSFGGATITSSAFNDAGKGYVLTSDNKIHTNALYPGGMWEETATIPGATSVALSLDNPLHAVVVGTGGQIFSTENAFKNETLTPLRISLPALNGVAALVGTAVAVGNGGTVVKRTTDGHWSVLPAPLTENLRRAALAADGSLAATSSLGVLYTNSDLSNPNAWLELRSNLSSSSINELTYIQNTLFVGAADGNIYRKNGAQFDVLSTGAYSINAVLQDGNAAWAVGDKGAVYRIENSLSDLNWQPQGKAVATHRITATCQTPAGTYFAATVDGFIGNSLDGSRWEFPTNKTNNPLHVVRFFDDQIGLAAGENTVLYTTNGGVKWTAVPANTSGLTFNDLWFVDKTKALLVGDNGKIHTIEGNNFGSLAEKNSPVATSLNSIRFHGNTGYIAGDNGVILQSKDLEGSWTSLLAPNLQDWTKYTDPTSGISRNLNSVSVIDDRTAYVSGDRGIILKTIDGGVTWHRKESGTTEDLTQLAFDGNRTAFFAGTNATLMRMADNSDRFSARFFYDKLGRMVASQNSKQQAMDPPRYSYTHYDALGRVVEVGEMAPNADRSLSQELLDKPGFADSLTAKRYQVVRTQYDRPLADGVSNLFTDNRQQNLRNRVASVIYQDTLSALPGKWNHATHVSYDIHGNVKELIQDNPALKEVDHQYKKLVYEYDLISGNVNKVRYQPGMADQFFHKYEYDADNRIVSVYTSKEGLIWDNDAKYQYYKHGPLARTELGDLKVQGVDYAYTLQGWIKAVNANSLNPENDMGGDGTNNVSKDAFGYSLHYNSNDYKAIGGSEQFLSAVASGAASAELFNGNISKMATAISNMPNMTKTYKYDELNRLIESNTYENGNATEKYKTSYEYDANGNLQKLTRNGNRTDNLPMDNLTYRYAKDGNGNILNNRLLHVHDAVHNATYSTDIDDQGVYAQNNPRLQNYTYDEIGNMIADKQEEIEEIVWNVQGKVQEIRRKLNSTKESLKFGYDGFGNRISKTVIYPTSVEGVKELTSYYVRDMQGNVMAVYEKKKYADGTADFALAEQHIYGSSRLGMLKTNQLLVEKSQPVEVDLAYSSRVLGEKQYELTNHLGNVLAVVSDKKLADNEPDVSSTTDYYPFGMAMPSRTWNRDSYRYGFQNQETENGITGSPSHSFFKHRISDNRLGRFFSVDPLFAKYPWNSSYAFSENQLIAFIELEGLEKYYAQDGVLKWQYGNSTEIRVVNDAFVQQNQGSNVSLSSINANSVTLSDYATSVSDVLDDAPLETWANNGRNCNTAALKQMSNAGQNTQNKYNAIQTDVDNSKQPTSVQLTENKVGGTIYTITQLRKGNPVMVGVKETDSNGNVVNVSNYNRNTAHFIVVSSINKDDDGSFSFGYYDNADASTGKSPDNQLSVDLTTGAATNSTNIGVGGVDSYEVSEVRKNVE
jgi:photosystem II stability/assembly factor-like uncharacterized protein